MNLSKLLLPALAALAIASPASAVVFTGSNGGNSVADYSGAGVVSFDLDLHDLSRTTLNFVVEADDLLASGVRFNTLVRNLSGAGVERFNLALAGASFAGYGSVTPTFGSGPSVIGTADGVSIGFAKPEWSEFHVGNPLSLGDKQDFLLNLGSLKAGDAFTLTTSVPEPATVTLLLAGLALLSFAASGRKP